MVEDNRFKKGKAAINGIFSGLSEILDKLNDMAEKGDSFSKGGNLKGDEEDGVKGVYGFSVKVGIGGQGPTVEPFGNIRKDKTTGKSKVHEVREPMVDLFEEDDHTLILAEMPGMGTEDVKIEMKEDLLILSAQKGKKKYQKEILLPKVYRMNQIQIHCNNGIVEIKCCN